MLDSKIEEMQREQKDLLKKELEVIKKINANSAEMSKEEILELDEQRKEFVNQRRELAKKTSVVAGLLRDTKKRGSAALEVLASLLEGSN